jgi:cobalt-zinc-cadmium efflux system outer membrane protein
LTALGVVSSAQSEDISEYIRKAQSRSSLVKSAVASFESRQANQRSVGSAFSPVLELSPGFGFTNGNNVLGQELDIFGRRRAASTLAAAQTYLAQIDIASAKATVSKQFLTSLAQAIAADKEVENALAARSAAQALRSAVAKQQEIGEAPRLHVTRSEMEVLRAEQVVALAKSRQAAAQAGVSSLLGEQLNFAEIAWPTVVPSGTEARSFELLVAEAQFSESEAQSQVVRSDYAPSVSAGIASDAWSLDRRAFNRNNFGVQLTFRVPLFNAGQRRDAIQSTNLAAAAARAKVEEARRAASLRLTQAQISHATLLQVSKAYDGDVIPNGEAMLAAMTDGYSAGIVTMLEVLEAQQTMFKLRQERVQALLELRLADIQLWDAQLALPAAEVNR